MSYESVNGLGDEMSDLLSSATARPSAVQVTGGGFPAWGGARPAPIATAPDWTSQTYVPPVYAKGPATRVAPPLLITNTWRPPPISVAPPPVTPGGLRPAMRPKVVFPDSPPPPTPPMQDVAVGCPAVTNEIPWLWIALAAAAGGGIGYMIKQQMNKKPSAKGAVAS